jgi:hypothetical protein
MNSKKAMGAACWRWLAVAGSGWLGWCWWLALAHGCPSAQSSRPLHMPEPSERLVLVMGATGT